MFNKTFKALKMAADNNKTMIYLFRCSVVPCVVLKQFELQKYPRKKMLNNTVSLIS